MIQEAIAKASQGKNGGGTVKIGGGFQGNDASIANSQSTTIDATTTIQAEAGASGDGGTVIVRSDGKIEFPGSILARGGKIGEGGFVKVSGKQTLSFLGTVNSIGAETLTLLLGSNNVTLQTSSDGSEAGDILIDAPVWWDSQYSLTLMAHRDITFKPACRTRDCRQCGKCQRHRRRGRSHNRSQCVSGSGYPEPRDDPVRQRWIFCRR